MRVYGLLGYPLTHSFSKRFFTEKFLKEEITDCRYENFSIENIEEAVKSLRSTQDLSGFNITIPHKVNMMPYLDEATADCLAIRSCNCVKVSQGKWVGHNTDVTGFSQSIAPLLKPHHTKALVFGTGGASLAVKYALSQMNIKTVSVSRTASPHSIAYGQVTPEVIASHTVLINTTPLGMFPHTDDCPHIPYDSISNRHLAYDLIYNPEETLFLKLASQKGATCKNGAEMLVIQAEESWEIWQQ